MKNLIFIFLLSSWLLSGCSKAPEKTSATLKLKLSGMANFTTGIGSGGALLFGRSANGELFGKVLVGMEDNLDIPNGDWSFYALMWDTLGSGKPMNDKVHCGKMITKLSGTDITLNINLTNANCTDPEFSNGRYYSNATTGAVRFADFFVEECDDINSATWYCGPGNQGSALSYRLKFQSFKKAPGMPFAFGAEALLSSCTKIDKLDVNDLMRKGLPVNFPSGNGTTPFVVSLEMFLGSDACNTTEAKGVHSIVLQNGLGVAGNLNSKVLTSNTNCSFSTTDFPTDINEKRNQCDAYMGSWNVSSCGSIHPFITRFAPSCASQTAGNFAIKHLVAIPKALLCERYIGLSSIVGTHPFAGGNGSSERPYKICNEWQMNQIGEVNAPDSFRLAHYKLMNDLDMNKTDFGPYAKPLCLGSSAVIGDHHNFNPFPKLESSCGSMEDMSASNGFQGVFNGNGKTISHIRISAKDATYLGFVRKMYGGSVVKNLVFENLEVEGSSLVGGIAGLVDANGAKIENIKIKGLRIDGEGTSATSIGGAVGEISGGGSLSELRSVVIKGASIRGDEYVGGLVGISYGSIIRSGFTGKIEQHDSSKLYVGGLVGYALGPITESFSEGLIATSTQKMGGIAARSDSSITASYSTMAINSRHPNTSAYIGGIVGVSNGSISDVYFDGVLAHSGGPAPSINGIVSAGSNSATTCYATYAPVGSTCPTSKTYVEMRDSTSLTFTAAPNPWVKTVGSVPRLLWEQRECALTENQLSLANQVSTLGRGTVLNPLILCNESQFKALSARSASEYYRLADDINLGVWSGQADTIASFNGVLNGDQHAIYGANLTVIDNSVPEYIGLININSGTIKNLKVYNNRLNINTAENSAAVLVGKNDGLIHSVELHGNEVMSGSAVGAVAGKNSAIGEINLVDVQEGFVKGSSQVGGVVGHNMLSGRISRASAGTKIMNQSTPSSFTSFGGVVGTNAGSVNQARFSGRIEMSMASTATSLSAGGIAGSNSGSITNTFSDPYSSLTVKNTTGVGGLVGTNTGSLSKSFSMGRVIYDNSNALALSAMNFHSLAGGNTGTLTSAFWLENTAASKVGQTSSTSFSGSAPVTLYLTGGLSFADTGNLANAADLFLPTYFNNESQFLTPLTLTAMDTFTYSGPIYGSGTDLSFYRSYVLGYSSGQKSLSELEGLSTFCSSFTGTIGRETCADSNEFDIIFYDPDVLANNKGEQRMIDYYKAIMYKTIPPADSPVWELETGDKYPRLMQLLDH